MRPPDNHHRVAHRQKKIEFKRPLIHRQTSVCEVTATWKSVQEPDFIDVGVGYQFNQWFRADVTAEYRTAVGLKGVFNEKVFL